MKLDSIIKQDLGLPSGLGGVLEFHQKVTEMYQPHSHPELEMNLVTSGTATYVLDGNKYELGEGSLVWLFPDQPHILMNASNTFGYWLGIYSQATLDGFELDGPASVLTQKNPKGQFCRSLRAADSRLLFQVFESCLLFDGASVHRVGLQFSLLSAWRAFEQGSDSVVKRTLHPSIELALKLLRDENFEGGLDSLAFQVGLTAPYLSQQFKLQVGVGITEFRNKVRLESFRRILKSGQLSLEASALEAGFGSYAQFYRVYRAEYGTSPSDRGLAGERG